MALQQTVDLLGDKALMFTMNELKRGVKNQVMRPAVREGLKVMKQHAQGNTPHPDFKKMLKTRVGTSRRRGGSNVVGRLFVGAHKHRTIKWKVRSTKGGGQPVDGKVNFAAVAAFYEFGTQYMVPTFWMRRSAAASKRPAMSVVTRRARKELGRQIKKTRARGREAFA